jgi:hypothetical protein
MTEKMTMGMAKVMGETKTMGATKTMGETKRIGETDTVVGKKWSGGATEPCVLLGGKKGCIIDNAFTLVQFNGSFMDPY